MADATPKKPTLDNMLYSANEEIKKSRPAALSGVDDKAFEALMTQANDLVKEAFGKAPEVHAKHIDQDFVKRTLEGVAAKINGASHEKIAVAEVRKSLPKSVRKHAATVVTENLLDERQKGAEALEKFGSKDGAASYRDLSEHHNENTKHLSADDKIAADDKFHQQLVKFREEAEELAKKFKGTELQDMARDAQTLVDNHAVPALEKRHEHTAAQAKFTKDKSGMNEADVKTEQARIDQLKADAEAAEKSLKEQREKVVKKYAEQGKDHASAFERVEQTVVAEKMQDTALKDKLRFVQAEGVDLSRTMGDIGKKTASDHFHAHGGIETPTAAAAKELDAVAGDVAKMKWMGGRGATAAGAAALLYSASQLANDGSTTNEKGEKQEGSKLNMRNVAAVALGALAVVGAVAVAKGEHPKETAKAATSWVSKLFSGDKAAAAGASRA